MTREDRFQAAVEIIRKLPKSGSSQQSYTLQLTFYSYYKRATVSPCMAPRPPCRDIVARAKQEPWSSLGTTDRTTAMEKYVTEFVGKKTSSDSYPRRSETTSNIRRTKTYRTFHPTI
ncbi:hypothetical protein BIW11_08363 [Tropilaelaps mercedesae]|uniref:ACB domain-containing protein n=1 Tax=Tropilaelaps mercedesae TaxID=418985 RepID=A0A1V9XQ19_9ACAR|nr:hypothetical protein BIW11_08363 [Tropilaelaps mercedesae]